jgi:VPDSG-CTERM motif
MSKSTLKITGIICALVGLMTIVQPARSAPILYGGAGNFGTLLDGSILTLNQSTGAGTLVGTPSALGITGLAFDSLGNLYGSTIKGGVTLEKINPDNGLQISSIALSIGMGDLSFQPGTDVLFGISTSGTLYTINVTTGAETLVGDTGTFRTGGLGFAPDGTLYLAGLDPSPNTTTGFALHTLNPATGAILTSHPVNLFYDGLGVRPSDGVLFGNTAGIFGDNIVILNPATGAENLIGSTGITKVSDLAFRDATVPDTGTTFSLFGLSLMGLGFLRRKLY